MLATLTERRFTDPAWLFERKLDGERCMAYRSGRDVRLMSRNRLDITDQYPELEAALASQANDDFVIDGEIVAFDRGRTSFSRLQRRMHVSRPDAELMRRFPVAFVVFDVPYLLGFDLTGLGLKERKALLRKAIGFGGALRFAAHRNREGESYYVEACSRGWEGLIAKRADSPYVSARSKDWLKFKCVLEQELVIGGWTDPQGARTVLGALLVGYYEGGDLVYAGKAGTGFDVMRLNDLGARLAALEQDRPPFTRGVLPRKGVHWAKPVLVGQVGFGEWPEGGHLRHPRFLGLRPDKPAHEVIRERPQA